MKKNILMTMAVIVLVFQPVYASQVTYIVEGDITEGSQKRGMEGAHLLWKMQLDINAVPDSTGSHGSNETYASYKWETVVLSSTALFTNRPQGLSDLASTVYLDPSDPRTEQFLRLQNAAPDAIGSTDRIGLISRYYEIKTDPLGIYLPTIDVQFNRDFFDGEGVPSIPTEFDMNDVVLVTSSNPNSVGMQLNNIQVSAVPIPAAVWLFGSGLGLLGWMRRKPA
jgi:hypothetical protein